MDWNMLYELTMADGVPGNEKEARDVMEKYIAPVADSVETDRLGSLIAKKVGTENGPKVVVAGHLDEIGLMVTRIEDSGYIRFQTLGGWWSQVMLSQRFTITTREGKKVTGVIGSKPPHVLTPEARNKPVDIKDMFIDLGVASKAEVLALGVRPGDMIAPYFESMRMNNEKYLLAKAWDNRIGCAIAIDVLTNLKDVDHANVVYGVGTAQEEVGLRGARTSAAAIQPDIAFALDVTIAGDTPGMAPTEASVKMGEGPCIMLYDASMVAHKGLRDFVVNVAEELEIPFQFDALSGGGTDSGAYHLNGQGVPSLSICLASRYIHSHASMIHEDDYLNATRLITEVIKRLDKETVETIIYG